MTEHPITPPPELVTKWLSDESSTLDSIAIRAARWGADQELDACCDWVYKLFQRGLEWSKDLRAARRPKPTLKQQALEALDRMWTGGSTHADWDLFRSALESLPD